MARRGEEWGNVHAKQSLTWKQVQQSKTQESSASGSGSGSDPARFSESEWDSSLDLLDVVPEVSAPVADKPVPDKPVPEKPPRSASVPVHQLKRKAVASPVVRQHSRPRRSGVQLNASLNESALVGECE